MVGTEPPESSLKDCYAPLIIVAAEREPVFHIDASESL